MDVETRLVHCMVTLQGRDIAEVTKPARLGVRAEFTRRGGIDINAERQKGFGDWPYQRHYRQ